MVVELRCETPQGRAHLRRIRAQAVKLLKILALDCYELSIVLTNDESIHTLNREFRHKNSATDVLSFPQFEPGWYPAADARMVGGLDPSDHGAVLGDIVISVDTATRQADETGITAEARLRTLLIHGLLHLLGYDHEISQAEARRMFARERELGILLANGIGRPGARLDKLAETRVDEAWPPAAVPARSSR
jgi:probable rRNA maturation factor